MKFSKKSVLLKLNNIKRIIFLSLIILISKSYTLYGQECNCLKNISLLQNYIEKNQASYQHQVVEQKRLYDYTLFKSEVNKKARKIQSKKDCIGLISWYLSFFRDEHSFIAYENNYIPKPNPILNPNPNTSYKTSSIGGSWYFKDGSYSIDIFKSKTVLGNWVGVYNDGNSNSWKKGQIKLELFRNPKGNLTCIFWRKNGIPKTYAVNVKDSTLILDRNTIFYRKKPSFQNIPIISNNFEFRKLSEETNLIKIPSFDISLKHTIDSLITKNSIEIKTKKNLIIDIRNNGGGGFEAFQSILPFVLDTSLTETPYYGSVWVSKDNFDYYDSTKYEYAESKQDSLSESKYVEYLKNYLNHFTPIEKSIDTVQLEANSPLNIAIIFNKNTASSAEGFILQASTSKRVKTFGENSTGAVSYGDWMPMNLPELNIWVAITTKKMIFQNNEDFESIGISPDIDLRNINETDWVQIILQHLEK